MATNAKRLAKARKTRSLIARTFSALTNEQLTIADVLHDPTLHHLQRIRIYDVLRRVPHLNRTGAEKVLRLSKVWPLTTVGNLSREDKSAILRHLPPRVRR